MESFLATVDKVFPTNTDFLKYEGGDAISIYNGNKAFAENDARMYGAITYKFEDTIVTQGYSEGEFDTGILNDFDVDSYGGEDILRMLTGVSSEMFNDSFYQ